MQEAGFNGFSRGERGNTAENLVTIEYKIQQDEKRLSDIEEKIAQEQIRYDRNHDAFMTFLEIDNSGKKSITGKYTVSADDYKKLISLAKRSYSAETEATKFKEENQRLLSEVWSLKIEISQLKQRLKELTDRCRPYLEALRAAPKAVKEFIDDILEKFKKQENDIIYKPIPAPQTQHPERKKRSKIIEYER